MLYIYCVFSSTRFRKLSESSRRTYTIRMTQTYWWLHCECFRITINSWRNVSVLLMINTYMYKRCPSNYQFSCGKHFLKLSEIIIKNFADKNMALTLITLRCNYDYFICLLLYCEENIGNLYTFLRFLRISRLSFQILYT